MKNVVIMNDFFIIVPVMLDEAFEYLEERKVRTPMIKHCIKYCALILYGKDSFSGMALIFPRLHYNSLFDTDAT